MIVLLFTIMPPKLFIKSWLPEDRIFFNLSLLHNTISHCTREILFKNINCYSEKQVCLHHMILSNKGIESLQQTLIFQSLQTNVVNLDISHCEFC